MSRLSLAFLLICLAFAAVYLLRPGANFKHAPGEIEVERIDASGAVVHEGLHPLRAPYLAVYHGAGWCPPCQRFSPHLAEFYHSSHGATSKFQLVMVDYDRSEADMLAYMRQHTMEFPSVMRGAAGAWGRSTGSGIPNLMVIDTATGKVLSSSFDGDRYVGPEVPLQFLKDIAR